MLHDVYSFHEDSRLWVFINWIFISRSWRSDDRHQGDGRSVDGEGSDADLSFDLVPGLLRLRCVLNVEQSVVDPGKRLARVFIVTAGSKNDMPTTDEKEISVVLDLVRV